MIYERREFNSGRDRHLKRRLAEVEKYKLIKAILGKGIWRGLVLGAFVCED